jgi:hypothetical protein
MLTILARNVTEALHIGLGHLKDYGEWHETRTGKVLEYPGPVVTQYKCPRERVLFSPIRDANPFFHLFEAFWMLGGQEDVDYVKFFNKRMMDYSDDGWRLNGAYGYRWRRYFHSDQLDQVVSHLIDNPASRRAVVSMWDPEDLERAIADYSDVPCNTHIYFKRKYDKLNMTVLCRSNDVIWGVYGANAVHFSILQEYIASQIGIEIGNYYHVSDSYHAYEEPFNKVSAILGPQNGGQLWYDSYLGLSPDGMHYTPAPIFEDRDQADIDIEKFLGYTRTFMNSEVRFPPSPPQYANKFFIKTAHKMFSAWYSGQVLREYKDALSTAKEIEALDWRKASIEWLERRKAKWELKRP